MKLLGIGNALVDILTNLSSDNCLNEMGLKKNGMVLIKKDQLFKIIDLIENLDSKLATGGSASNTISGAARMGIECGFIGKVGNDSYGRFYREDLINNNVQPHLTEIEESTGCAMCMITPDSERTMGTYLGASDLHDTDLHPGLFHGYDMLHTEGYLVQNHDMILKAFRLAKEAGLKISIDLASYNIVEGDFEFFHMMVKEYVDIVFANQEEAFAFTKKEPMEAAEELSKICEIAVVKMGAHGSIIRRGDETVTVEAIKANCIDTTGAGDLYAAGCLYGLSRNLPLKKCAMIGSILSGNVVEIIGTKMDNERWDKVFALVKEIENN